MKKLIFISLAVMAAVSLAACGRTQTPEESERQSADVAVQDDSESVADTEKTNLTDESVSAKQADVDDVESGSNILVAYFSLAGEQYAVGVIEEGNTSIIAHMIAEQTGADLFEIEAATPYPESHSELLEVSQEEMSENARPEIVGTVENMADYDTVFIGFPNWWGDMPMIVYNFIESYDFAGKTVIPFCTHGGSGLSRTESTIEEITQAVMLDGFAISGETAQNNRDRSRDEVVAWLNEIGFAK